MTPKLIKMLTAQAQVEGEARSCYLQLRLWADREDWHGSAGWFSKSADEEAVHQKRFLRFLNDYADDPVLVPATEAPGDVPKSLPEAFAEAMKMEVFVLEQLRNISDQATLEKAHEVVEWLDAFLEIQVESIRALRRIVRLLKRAGNDMAALGDADRVIRRRAKKL